MRKALLVGIDEYAQAPLQGCVRDAERLRNVLSTHADGSPNFACRTILAGSDSATEAELLEEIDKLFRDKTDFALLHFSGHGTVNNLGGYLVTQRSRKYNEGIRMTDVIDLANQSAADEILITLDCCHAGAFGNLPRVDNTIELREGVSILTASRDSQEAAEGFGGGVFVSLLYDAMSGGAADILGRVTIGSLYAYVDQALGPWEQRPLFKSHVSQFASIRNCEPAITSDKVRLLKTYFPSPAATKKLDPSFEPTAEPHDADNEAVFADLQRMRAVGLVEPETEDHLYYEAINNGGCRLTPLGRYYWQLASKGRI